MGGVGQVSAATRACGKIDVGRSAGVWVALVVGLEAVRVVVRRIIVLRWRESIVRWQWEWEWCSEVERLLGGCAWSEVGGTR